MDAEGRGTGESDVVAAVAMRACGSARQVWVERVAEGVSTRVYRVLWDGPILYVRVLPEGGAGFGPEALAHGLLLQRGARVPRVLHVEEREPVLQRSVMVTTEVPGVPLTFGAVPHELPEVLAAAGRDLAAANGIPVEGFGWVRRDAGAADRLRGEHASFADWALTDADRSLVSLEGAGLLSPATASGVRRVFAGAEWAWPATATLAHGDFDAGQIYHSGGTYTGIIDFGEIRGAEPTYDLGQFAIEHPDWLPLLLAGYREAAGVQPDLDERIALSSLLIATRRLAHFLRRGRAPHPPDLEAVARALRHLA